MGISRTRRRLLLGSALAVTSLFTYGRNADAACTVTVSPTYECSGINGATQSILNVTDATVSTLPGFSVDAAAGNGIEISGDGAISFTDANSSTITSAPTGLTTHGIDIMGLGAGAGIVAVDINSVVTGAAHGINAINNGIGALSINVDGNLTGNGGYGIHADQNIGAGLQITTGVNASILGSTVGLRAFHSGTGNMLIDTNGDVAGTANFGIDASNYANAANLTINTGVLTQVTGGEVGIQAKNYGAGMLSIAANGDVTGTGFYGIYARNFVNGSDLSITTATGSTITGGEKGISVRNDGAGPLKITTNGDVVGLVGVGIAAGNYGTGTLEITANGDVMGVFGSGIYGRNTASGTDMTVTTTAIATIAGGKYGIRANNFGTGVLEITANGDVTGTDLQGIFAYNKGTDLAIATGVGTTVLGGHNGIDAKNNGTGAFAITTNGDVTGTDLNGINAYNLGTDLTVITGYGTTVEGGVHGIYARNDGSGALAITANDDVTGTNHSGVYAKNSLFTTDLTVTTGGGMVTGSNYGINARNFGTGALEITAYGGVTGTSIAGINARIDSNGTDLTITTGADSLVLGGTYGIRATNSGSGMIAINIDGGLSTISPTPGFNLDGIAIQTGGNADAIVVNQGLIVGRINTAIGDDLFGNAGIWASNGISDFGGGTNSLVNIGQIVAANTGGVAETTTFANAGTFNNLGLLSLSDETAGNGSQAHDVLTVDGDFAGGGLIFMNAYLGGPGSTADLMIVTGNVSGVTQLQVINASSGGGATNLDGIALVQVNGTSAAGDFVLMDGPISAGLFTYDLQFDAGDSVHELVSTGAAAVSAELATFASAAQSIWYDTLRVLDERFDELHKDIRGAAMISEGMLVRPVSGNPSSHPGLWGKLVGRTADRDATSSVGGVATDISYGLDATGLVIGVDGVLDSANGSLALGATGGYVTADQGFDSGSAANYEGFTGGFYATYVNGNFHVNGQLKANVLDLDYTMAGTSGTSDAAVISLGAALETGYRVDVANNFYAEPAAQLAYVDSSIHNGDALGTAFRAGGDSLRGAIGLNLGGKINSSDFIFKPELTLKVWGEFEGDNSASFTAFAVADNTPGVFGEAGLGIEALSLSNGWSGNLKGDVQFGEDFTSFGGFAGLRKSF